MEKSQPPLAPIAITQDNKSSIIAMYKDPTPEAMKQCVAGAVAHKLSVTDRYGGNTMCVYQRGETQIGVLVYADGCIGLFSTQSVLLPISVNESGEPTGVAVLMKETGKMGTKGNVGAGVKGTIVDPKFAKDMMHVMIHDPAVNKPHSCTTPPPGASGPGGMG